MHEKTLNYDNFIRKLRISRVALILLLLFSIFSLIQILFGVAPFIFIYLFSISFVLFILLYIYLALYFDREILKEMSYVYNWTYFGHGDMKDISWSFEETLKNLKIYSTLEKINFYFWLSGKFCDRDFILYDTLITSRFVRSGFRKSWFCITSPINNSKNIILIKPKKLLAKFINNIPLTKIEVDTQGLFDIYADNPQEALNVLTSEFMSRLIFFGKKMKDSITFLITPKGVLFFKQIKQKDSVSFFALTSSKQEVLKQFKKVEDFLKLLDLINLLEKK